MDVYVIGSVYPQLEQGIAAAGGSITADSSRAQGVVVSVGGSPAELLEVLTSNPAIRWAQLPSAGIERFNDSLRARPDLAWTSAKGAYAAPVAEHALALTLALLRELPTRVRARSWAPATGTSLHGLRVMVVGAGGVGLETARLMQCFDTHVTMVRRLPKPVPSADATISLDEMRDHLPKTDVLVLAAALTPHTHHMVDAAALEALPDEAILVNIGRGGLVDTEALVNALQREQLAGAALDVTDPEPLPDGHPLWEEPRALITPHAADTLEMIQPLFAQRVSENLRRVIAVEELIGVVDAEAGY
ncbi:NAD-binding protein [Nesterenkonia sp. MY13]|uniref:NAD-binding protein n=1 Tax=Nesterenkonia sedimenti TaxID=1463632 RepID=A0A7X8TIJ0_9MICC|nr:NAD(P)-dependent oxidoreductase [Nesterenkonia sedimenti]NLS09244.1 NAD-binding protein [Nesterenkonia sedimenti]